MKTLFFDYDGTLHDTIKIYAPAFKKAYRYLVRNHNAPDKKWRDEEISQFIGQTPKEMWDQFGEDIPENAKKEASKIVSNTMKTAITNKEATLYEGTLDVLSHLKDKGYSLVFISNCKNYYLEAHRDAFGLDRYFDRMVCSETFPGVEEKHRVLRRIKDDFEAPMAIIGDRHHDIEAGEKNGIHTIGAAYGFGSREELKSADLIIEDIKALKNIF